MSFRNLINRFKGVKRILETKDYLICQCQVCRSYHRLHKNYGKLHVPCKCGKIHVVFTGKSKKTEKYIPKDIYDELKITEYDFIDEDERVLIRGKCINNSIRFLAHPIGCFKFSASDFEFLFFPGLDVKNNKNVDTIEPFEEIEFYHFLTEEESEEARKCNFEGFHLTFLQYDIKSKP